MAYSGQCLTSESLGGRSANRGQCAQACRLPYDLVCDGEDVDLGDVKYLLSPQDLAAYDLVPELIDAGVSSFKIEGRLKTPEYVANITRHYRRAIDAAAAGRRRISPRKTSRKWSSRSRAASRPAGSAAAITRCSCPGEARPSAACCWASKAVRGRSVVVAARRARGTRRWRRLRRRPRRRRRTRRPRLRSHVAAADRHRTGLRPRRDRLRQIAAWPATLEDRRPASSRRSCARRSRAQSRSGESPLDLVVQPPSASRCASPAKLPTARAATWSQQSLLAAANKHPLTQQVLEQQLGRLGGTVYELRNLRAEIVGEPMVAAQRARQAAAPDDRTACDIPAHRDPIAELVQSSESELAIRRSSNRHRADGRPHCEYSAGRSVN